MSEGIERQLDATGHAQVLVFLSTPAAASAAAAVGAAALESAPAGAVDAEDAPATEDLMRYFVPVDDLPPATSARSGLSAAARRRRKRRAAGLESLSAAEGNGDATPAPVNLYPNLGVMLGTVEREGLEGLRADPRVANVTAAPALSIIAPVRVAATSSTGALTWGIRAMRIPELWSRGLTGDSVLVGHLDTGVDGDHPALADAIEAFAEFDMLGRRVEPDPEPFDTEDHGTHTAATIAGRPVNGRRVGVAPGSRLASAVVIEGGHVIARVLGGMDWAVANNVRILNMSLGFRGFFEDFLPLTLLLRSRNILPVFAVGNEGEGQSRSPGNYGEALSVGAHNRSGAVADFSSSQTFTRPADPIVPDLVAPGVGVVSARPGGGFQLMDGSSMATPHVSGLAALLMEARPTATVDEIERAIFKSCLRRPGMLESRCNRGIPDAVRALEALT